MTSDMNHATDPDAEDMRGPTSFFKRSLLHSKSYITTFTDCYSRLDIKSQATVLRLLSTPIFYSLLSFLLPWIAFDHPYSIWYIILTELCGVVNFIVWVAVDADARACWLTFFKHTGERIKMFNMSTDHTSQANQL